MKHSEISPLSRPHFLAKSVLGAILVVSVSASSPLTAAPANDNLGSQKSGAFVTYSSPLKGGASPNTLVSGQPNSKVSFANQGGTHLVVIDLGKPSKLNTVQLKFTKASKLNVFVLKSKPDDNNWSQAIAGLTPDGAITSSGAPASLDGAEGEFLVLVCPNNPGSLSDFSVSGVHLGDPNHQFAFNNQHGAHQPGGGGALAETPIPSSVFYNQTHPEHPVHPPVPPVPPQSR